MQLNQLPRNIDGAVEGQWMLRHRLPTFEADLGVTAFVNGVTTRPVGGVVLQRIMASLGDNVSAEPWPEDTTQPSDAARPKAIRTQRMPDGSRLEMNDTGKVTAIVSRGATQSVGSADASPATAPAPVAPATAPAAAAKVRRTPTTREELAAVGERDLRSLVKEMGEAEGAKKWDPARLRRYVAEELSIE
jgi:hypothetical protein